MWNSSKHSKRKKPHTNWYLKCLNIFLSLSLLGEHITEEELAEYLAHLFAADNGNEDGGADGDEGARESFSLEERLPESISISMFAKQLLGLDLSIVSWIYVQNESYLSLCKCFKEKTSVYKPL